MLFLFEFSQVFQSLSLSHSAHQSQKSEARFSEHGDPQFHVDAQVNVCTIIIRIVLFVFSEVVVERRFSPPDRESWMFIYR